LRFSTGYKDNKRSTTMEFAQAQKCLAIKFATRVV